MYRQTAYMIIMSLLLVGLGFFLGQYYALSRGVYWETSKVLSFNADSPVLFSASQEEKAFSTDQQTDYSFAQFAHDLSENDDLQFTSKIGTFYLDKVVSGKKAMDYSQQILGNEAPVKRVFIPHYRCRDNQAIIWVFEMDSLLEAVQYLDKINMHITESDTFDFSGSFFLQNVEVYYVKGLNVDNYYYCKDNFIYWFSLVTDDPIPLFLKFYEYY